MDHDQLDEPADVSTELLLPGHGSGGAGVRATDTRRGVRLRLEWRASDPLAVALRMRPVPDHPALPRGEWVVLRDFLRYGLEVATGDGDVRLTPDSAQNEIDVELHRDGRCHRVRMPCWSVRDFLDETERMVPSGAETSDASLDALIARLLDG